MQKQLRHIANRIKGGTPLERHHEIMNRDSSQHFPLTQLDDLLVIDDPPPNASQQTVEELRTLQHRIPQRLDDRFMERANTEYVDLLFECVHHPRQTDELRQTILQIVDQADKFIVKAKYHYNRPRPRQLAAFYGLELTPLHNPACPSYPSGHTAKTMLAHLALEHLTDDFSYDRKEARHRVAKVAYSRLQAKVHFPSDVRAGLDFGCQIMSHFCS